MPIARRKCGFCFHICHPLKKNNLSRNLFFKRVGQGPDLDPEDTEFETS